MGGAVSDSWKKANSEISGIPYVGNAASKILNVSPPGMVANAAALTDRTIEGAKTLQNAPRDAAAQVAAAQKTQSDAAAAAAQQLALQPKMTASDNFLAIKNRTLQNMRLGLQSTVGGSAGAATPSLSAPSLSGKSKTGN